MNPNETIFLKIINREIPGDIVYEDERVIAFKDINPSAPIHVLIVPKKHIRTVNDLGADDADLIGQMFLVAKKLAADLGVAEKGYRLVMNCNDEGGQEVFHIHLHFLAGRRLGRSVSP